MEQLLKNFPHRISSKQKVKPKSNYAPCAQKPLGRRPKVLDTRKIEIPVHGHQGLANEPYLHESRHVPVTQTYLQALRQSLDEIHACITAAIMSPRESDNPGQETYTTTAHIRNAVRHVSLLIPALARLSSYPHLFPDRAASQAFWRIVHTHLRALALQVAAYKTLTESWRLFAASDDNADVFENNLVNPPQTSPQNPKVSITPWRSWLQYSSIETYLQKTDQQFDPLIVSRTWQPYFNRMDEMRREGYVPLGMQIMPMQGILLAEYWRLGMEKMVDAITEISTNADVAALFRPDFDNFLNTIEPVSMTPPTLSVPIPTDTSVPIPELANQHHDSHLIWVTGAATIMPTNVIRGAYNPGADAARLYAGLGTRSTISRRSNSRLIRMLMRKMTPEERMREQAFLRAAERLAYLRFLEESRREREMILKQIDEKNRALNAENAADAQEAAGDGGGDDEMKEDGQEHGENGEVQVMDA